MAACAAAFAGLTADEIRTALNSFEGVARRQEVRGTVNGVTVVDDFAHHPTAIRQAIAGLRQRFPKIEILPISAAMGEGIPALKARLKTLLAE